MRMPVECNNNTTDMTEITKKLLKLMQKGRILEQIINNRQFNVVGLTLIVK